MLEGDFRQNPPVPGFRDPGKPLYTGSLWQKMGIHRIELTKQQRYKDDPVMAKCVEECCLGKLTYMDNIDFHGVTYCIGVAFLELK